MKITIYDVDTPPGEPAAWVVADQGGWIPGVFPSPEAAAAAAEANARFGGEDQAAAADAQDNGGSEVSTSEDLSVAWAWEGRSRKLAELIDEVFRVAIYPANYPSDEQVDLWRRQLERLRP